VSLLKHPLPVLIIQKGVLLNAISDFSEISALIYNQASSTEVGQFLTSSLSKMLLLKEKKKSLDIYHVSYI
jgi:hypothetical protein